MEAAPVARQAAIHCRFLSIEKHRHRHLPAAGPRRKDASYSMPCYIMITRKNYIVNRRWKISQFRQENLSFCASEMPVLPDLPGLPPVFHSLASLLRRAIPVSAHSARPPPPDTGGRSCRPAALFHPSGPLQARAKGARRCRRRNARFSLLGENRRVTLSPRRSASRPRSMGAGCQQNGPFAPSRPWAKGTLRGESLPGKPLCGFGLPPNPTEAAGAAAREPQGGFPTPCKPPQRAACAGCRKSGLRHFFEVFVAPLRLRRGQGAMQGNPCYARLFADLPYMPPNPIKA